MQVCTYASKQVCKYVQVCKYESMHVCKCARICVYDQKWPFEQNGWILAHIGHFLRLGWSKLKMDFCAVISISSFKFWVPTCHTLKAFFFRTSNRAYSYQNSSNWKPKRPKIGFLGPHSIIIYMNTYFFI